MGECWNIDLIDGSSHLSFLPIDLQAAFLIDESCARDKMLQDLSFYDAPLAHSVRAYALELATVLRREESGKGGMDALMKQYDLSCQEGVLLMCLAEALLRIPDQATAKHLIQDKLVLADWEKHRSKSHSTLTNCATWGLDLAKKMVNVSEGEGSLKTFWQKAVQKTGEPFIYYAMKSVMGALSHHFVLGEDMPSAYKASKSYIKKDFRLSYDMLGEAACTMKDADRYFTSYKKAIEFLKGKQSAAHLYDAPSVSVKLSALYPRYEFAKQGQAIPVLTKRFARLAQLARDASIALTLDAEEADRLEMSLAIFKSVYEMPEMEGWPGLGLAVQAYQKRAGEVIDWVIELSSHHKRLIPVRLVKGAYWDSEIKHAQMLGLSDYPVFTRKVNTDCHYIYCANKMLQAPNCIYPQFATHNVQTVATLLHLIKRYQVKDYEFQLLQGMGVLLHEHLIKNKHPSRVYAPVGTYHTLLPYLVRRLLENGANSSFVNAIGNPDYPLDRLLRDPVNHVRELKEAKHPDIPLPSHIYSPCRKNAYAPFLSSKSGVEEWALKMRESADQPLIGHVEAGDCAVENPATKEVLATLVWSDQEKAQQAFNVAATAFKKWQYKSLSERACILAKAADLLEESMAPLVALIVKEAGRVVKDAVEDVREAIDFCRYYANEGERTLSPQMLRGITGEDNALSYRGRGVMVAISPWNFPAAIFTGQISAALMAGNAVIAKPAEQTPLSAEFIVDLFCKAGLPRDLLHLVHGGAALGNFLVSGLDHAGVLFTGSNQAAWSIQKSLVKPGCPIVPFVAETGGINVLIADSSELPEQLVMDVIDSAFGSAGQRCSALRVLIVQEDIAPEVLEMLGGAMAMLNVGDPMSLATDVGPVIDQGAQDQVLNAIANLEKTAKKIAQTPLKDGLNGYFIAPSAYQIKDLSSLKEEVFGPLLHVMTYAASDIHAVIDQVNGLGYGLTFGVASRIDAFIDLMIREIRVGNFYINRSITGAVVGVQPFGGSGLSGTGPKAGGPNYLKRLAQEVAVSKNTTSMGGNTDLMSLSDD